MENSCQMRMASRPVSSTGQAEGRDSSARYQNDTGEERDFHCVQNDTTEKRRWIPAYAGMIEEEAGMTP